MKFALLAAVLALPMTGTAQAPEPAPAPQSVPGALSPDRPGCTPIVQQVAGDNRRVDGTRLNQQPPAQLMLAVDRQVDGCREATIIRRDIGLEPAPRR